MQLESLGYKSGGINASALTVGEQTADKVGLTLLQTLCTEGHIPEVGNHILCISERKMSQKAFVVLVNLIVYERIALVRLAIDDSFETCHHTLQERLVENHASAIHDKLHVIALKKITGLENDSVRTGIQHLNPKFFIEYLARKDEDAKGRISGSKLTTNVHSDGGTSA